MSNLSGLSVLLLALVASVAGAEEREPQIRNVILPSGPDQVARPVYVAGAVATVLRFEKSVDPSRTKMVGWEGRFEPLLAGGRSVVLVPLHDLEPEDRFPLVVTLVDGTEVPLTVTAEEGRVDHQVNLFWDRASDEYLRASLETARASERIYREKSERYEREEASSDHALAALLATEAVKQTAFRQIRRWSFKEADSEIEVIVYAGKSKAAVLFRITNHAERFWSLREARLTLNSEFDKFPAETRPCAVRSLPHAIAPGASGVVAVVADRSAFVSEKGLEALALQLIRQDGLVQALVLLDPALARR